MEKTGSHYHPLKSNPARWAHGVMSYRRPPGSVGPMTNNPRISRAKARLILHEGRVRGHRLTAKQRRFFGARASGYPMRRNLMYLNASFCRVCRARPHLVGCPLKRRRGRRNPSHRNPGGGTNWLLWGGLAVGAFFLLPRLTGAGGGLTTLLGGGAAAVPPGYTPIGSGLYRSPTGQVYARNPSTGQMVPAPAGTQPTSAEDLLMRAGISLIPSVTQNLASWVSSLFATQQTATGAVVGAGTGLPTGAVPGTPTGEYGPFLPPLAPLPEASYVEWGGTVPTEEAIFGGGEGLPPLTELPTYPTYDYPVYDYGTDYMAYDLPDVPPLDWDVALTVGSGEAVIANPEDWYGFMGFRGRPRFMGVRR